jgi:hypothetical protein
MAAVAPAEKARILCDRGQRVRLPAHGAVSCSNHVLAFDPTEAAPPPPLRNGRGGATPALRRPATARPPWHCGASRRKACDPPLPAAREIERIRGEINAGKRQIVWADTADSVFSEKLTADLGGQEEDARPRRVMIDAVPMDITAAPHAVKLISTTALVQDFIGLPYALGSIR